ncbi:MAG: response regulator [Candidatus Bathyarchaeota archaeon]|nr:response regulator [Candidatus Bathyarchaeota archaeon]
MIANILVIDDDAQMRSMLSSILQEEGYAVAAVENGKKALKTCEKTPFDLALIDVDLPDIKGVELLPQLKQMQPKMVKIIITGNPSIDNAVKAVNEKSDGFILKPFKVPELLEMIRKRLEEKKNEYLQMFTEVEKAKKEKPIFNYSRPSHW